MSEDKNESYLGDGLFVSVNKYGQVKLRTPRLEGDHEVFLEPEVLQAFLNWLVKRGIMKKGLES